MITYDRRLDRMTGHDYPGVRSHGFVQYELDELELGARVALLIGDPYQALWEFWATGNPLAREEAT